MERSNETKNINYKKLSINEAATNIKLFDALMLSTKKQKKYFGIYANEKS